MFSQVQVWPLAGHSQSDSEALLCYLGCVLRIIVLFEDKPSPKYKVQRALEQLIIKDSLHIAVLIFDSFPLDPD